MVYVYGNKVIIRGTELRGDLVNGTNGRKPFLKNLEILAAGKYGPIVNCVVYINHEIHAVEIEKDYVFIGQFDKCNNRNHFRWAQLRPDQQNWHEYADN